MNKWTGSWISFKEGLQRMVQVDIDPGAGFCFGVEEAVKKAEDLLGKGEMLYGLGDLVHNKRETKRLRELGLLTIRHDELGKLGSGKVLFRAHGEPPSTYALAQEHGVEVIDATCPIVFKLQERIRKAYAGLDQEKEQVVIFGKTEHPETIGLLGQVNGDAVVVSSVADLHRVDASRGVHLFSQTTMDPDGFRQLEEALKALLDWPVRTSFQSHCTICGQMKKRKPSLRAFASARDVVVFVSGRHSSNGKMLYGFCKGLNPRTHWISSAEEVRSEWFEGAGRVGISGATSTSLEQLEIIRDQVLNLISS